MSRISVGERIGVLGMARSGIAASRLALSRGASVYASDAGTGKTVRQAGEKLRELGADVDVGKHDLAKLAACDRIVLSPGIPPSAPVLNAPELAGIPIVPEMEFAYYELEGPVIAVTGTNGKTTVTALTAHVLRAAGVDAEAGGNIGVALSELALRDPQPAVTVVECSSFQLGRTREFAPAVGVLTNLAPDHLDWYETVEDYYADKARLFANATAESRWVVNGEDAEAVALLDDASGERFFFRIASEPTPGEHGGYLDGERLTVRLLDGDHAVIDRSELKILGPHNVANALASSLAAVLVGASLEGVAAGLRTFEPMSHRLEPIAEKSGVLWINDSKATNIASASVAICSMDRPTVLLLGGRHKREPYHRLIDVMRGRVRQVVAFGEAAELIEAALGDALPVERVAGPFEAVLERAAELARPGDAVLLSPACSSYDMFRDYEDRGQQFRRIVLEEIE